MQPGIVVRIRVNPNDCMGVVDLLSKTGTVVEGMSFSSMVSLALSSSIAAARELDVIPSRTGFEWAEVMGPFANGLRTKKKLEVTDTIKHASVDGRVPSWKAPKPVKYEDLPIPEPAPVSAELMRDRRALSELCAKKDLADDGQVIWQASDQVEYDRLYKIVYPEG